MIILFIVDGHAFLFAAFPPPLAEIDDLARFFMLTVAEEAIYG